MAMKERVAISSSGWLGILVGLGLMLGSSAVFAQIRFHQLEPAPYLFGGFAMIAFGILVLKGNFVIGPNEARVLTFFGRYTGTVRESGLRWALDLHRASLEAVANRFVKSEPGVIMSPPAPAYTERFFASDRFHPSAEGYAAMADAALPAAASVLQLKAAEPETTQAPAAPVVIAPEAR